MKAVVGLLDRSEPAPEDAHVLDATGLIVAPGFIDLHTHLREPGQEYKETIASGASAAVAGGWASIVRCPTPIRSTTIPPSRVSSSNKASRESRKRFSDRRNHQRQQRQRARGNGRDEKRGHRGCFDDGRPVPTPGMMRRAMEYARFRSDGRRSLPGSIVERGRRDARRTLVADSRFTRHAGRGRRRRRGSRLCACQTHRREVHIAHVSTRAIEAVRRQRTTVNGNVK